MQTKPRDIRLIGSASGWGAQLRETEKGPEILKSFDLCQKLQKQGISISWGDMIFPQKKATELSLPVGPEVIDLIEEQLLRLAATVENTLTTGHFPCVLGGDHVMAVGTFSGAIQALKARHNFGLLWIDAHMDSHTPQTTPSGAYHGMPVASLLGYGEPKLTDLFGPAGKVLPEHVILMGIRSFEPEEEAFLKKLNVRVYSMDEIQSRGFKETYQEAVDTLAHKTQNFGLSIDLDAFDPTFAPGVGSPEPGGLNPREVLPELGYSAQKENFSALEITEYNPERDQDHKTAQLVFDLVQHLFA